MIGQWLLLILYAILGLANLIRGVDAWMLRTVLVETALPLPVVGTVYLAFGLLFLGVGFLYFRKPNRRSRSIARGLALGYQVVLWTISLVGDRGVYVRRLWGRNLVFTMIFLIFVFLVTHRRAWVRR